MHSDIKERAWMPPLRSLQLQFEGLGSVYIAAKASVIMQGQGMLREQIACFGRHFEILNC
jgi:hypothetical protein